MRGVALVVVGAVLFALGFSATGGTAVVRGTDGKNALFGTKGPDTLYGRAGGDSLFAGGGNDRLYGGYGNDRLDGGAGDDHLYGGPGNDKLDGGPGRDVISCGAGHDVVHADARDRVAADCEVVIRPAVVDSPPPAATTTTTTATTTTTVGTTTTTTGTTTTPATTTTPSTTTPSTCGTGPQSYRYSLVNQPLASTSVSVTVTINQLPSYPATGDHGLAYVGVTYGVGANPCAALGWLQGGIWRGGTPYSADTGKAFLYVEWETTKTYQLIRLADVTVPSTHTFTLQRAGADDTWGIWVDGGFIASVVLDQAPTTFSTAAEDYSVDGDTYPSYDWTFSNASPSFAHAPTGKLPYDSFTGTGWHTSM